MEFSRIVLFFLFRVAIGALPLAYAQLYLLPESTPQIIRDLRWPISYGLVLVIYFIDQSFIYPRYRSPYRHLPKAPRHEPLAMVFESPRGKTPLTWVKAFPNADIIVSQAAFGISTLIPASVESLRDLLNTKAYDFQKPWGIRAFMSRALGFGLILSEGQEHSRQRKFLTPAFNIRKIRELYGMMWAKTNILLVEMGKQIQDNHDEKGFSVVEVTEWFSRLTLDIIGPTAMGQDFNSLQNESHPIANAFTELLEPRADGLFLFALHWIIPEYIVRRIPMRANRDYDRLTEYLKKECTQFVKEKKEKMAKSKTVDESDILGGIIQTGEFSDALVVDEMLTFLAAGHETTANALSWACYHCAKFPEIQSKLRAEIRQTIPSSESTITHDILENMPYLNGVCEETLRLYPTVPVTIREAIKDTTIAGTHVVKDTQFIVIPYAINRHPKFWGDNADEMIPERWIDVAENGSRRPNKNGGTSSNFSEITFLHGPRSCIGRDFAKSELRCAIAGLFGRFEMKLGNFEEPKITGIITMKAVGGIHLKFKELGGW